MAIPSNIALVTETWPPEINGVAMTLSRLVDGVRQKGYRVQVVRPRQRSIPDETPQNQEYFLVPGAPIPGYQGIRCGLPMRGKLLKHWQACRPDIVHIATEGPLGWAAMSAARRLGIPVTTSYHTHFQHYCGHYGLGWLRHGVAFYLRLFHNKAMCTLAPNEVMRDLLASSGYKNVGVLSRGVDTALFNPKRRSQALRNAWQIDDYAPAVLYVGRLAAEKNLQTVAAAFDALTAKCPSARMIWVGEGPLLAKMKRKCPEHIFAGVKTGEELAKHYASADIFLFASTTETFGNVTLEAMASGLAVVAFRYAAAGQFIRHNISGLTAEPGDNAEFCRQAASLGSNPALIQSLGKQASDEIQHLSWNTVLDQFVGVLEHAGSQGSDYV